MDKSSIKSKVINNGLVYDIFTGLSERRDLRIEGGLIRSIASHITPGPGEEVIDAGGNTIFPGFIDGHSHIGVLFQFPDSNDCNECSNPSTQSMRVVDAFRYDDPCLLENARAGITTALITPGSGNAVCGQAAIIKTYAPRPLDMIVNDYAAFKLAFGENPKSVYMPLKRLPMSRMGTAGVVSAFFERALRYREKRVAGGEYNFDYEMALPVLEKKVPLKIHAHRADDILTAIRIAKKYQIPFTLDHCTEGYLIIDELVKAEAPIFVGPLFMFKTKAELRNADPYAAIAYEKRGLLVSIASDHNITDSRFLPVAAGELVKAGLSHAAAIRMLTINPAKAIGMDEKIGSLTEGKEADLFIAGGDPLEIRTPISMTMIGGEIVPRQPELTGGSDAH
ncbi:MAG: amidohydrolase family protein [Treponema sp.]|jgi:imidazolonepropionase-like amidohydrolase|nr:amidohydrolase family protein [Treponema sp.]